MLTDKAIGEEFVRREGMGLDRDAQALVDRVTKFLGNVGLAHRNPYDVAMMALQRPVEPPLTQEEVAFRNDVMQGTGDARPPTAEDIRSMSMDEFMRERERLGVTGSAKHHGLFS